MKATGGVAENRVRKRRDEQRDRKLVHTGAVGGGGHDLYRGGARAKGRIGAALEHAGRLLVIVIGIALVFGPGFLAGDATRRIQRRHAGGDTSSVEWGDAASRGLVQDWVVRWSGTFKGLVDGANDYWAAAQRRRAERAESGGTGLSGVHRPSPGPSQRERVESALRDRVRRPSA